MKLIDKDTIKHAKEAARNTFNSLPFETRSKLANGYDRLHEIELLLSKGDRLCLAYIKERKRELEKWLLDWYNENSNNTKVHNSYKGSDGQECDEYDDHDDWYYSKK